MIFGHHDGRLQILHPHPRGPIANRHKELAVKCTLRKKGREEERKKGKTEERIEGEKEEKRREEEIYTVLVLVMCALSPSFIRYKSLLKGFQSSSHTYLCVGLRWIE